MTEEALAPQIGTSRRNTSPMQLRAFEPRDTAEVVRLLSIGRPEGYFDLKRQLFDWQFLSNPHSDGRSPFVVGEIDGAMIALNGFMPVRARFQGRPIETCWSCDTYVSGEHRGKGLGKQLIARVTASAPLMLGFGISDMSDPIFDKFEWRLHCGIELVFFHVAERGLRGKIKNAASRLASLRGSRVHGAEVEIWDAIDEARAHELDELWLQNAAGYRSAVERDGTYLRWKYFEHPFYRYRAYVMRTQGQAAAAFIVRQDATETVLADYSGPATREELIASLAAEVVADVSRRGTTRIKCESTHKPLIAALKKVGFISSSYASRFRVRVNVEAGDPFDGWLLMPGDSDGDLLVSTTVEAAAPKAEVA